MHTIGLDWRFYAAAVSGFPAIPVEGSTLGSLPVGAIDGSVDGSPQTVARYTATIAANGTQTIDLFTLTNALEGSVELAEVHAIVVVCNTAGGKGNIQKGASDPWTGLGTTPVVPFDASFPFFVGSAAGIAVLNTDKNIKVTNSGAASAGYTVFILGRS
jgi:hypothetical protein